MIKRLTYLVVLQIVVMVMGGGNSSYAQSLVINEIMQSNIDCIFVDHEFPDSWVELYNPTEDGIDLLNWRVSDVNNFESAWNLPAQEIPAGGYALIYCDKEETGLHTDFRLESGKGTLYLFSPDGEVADNLSFKKMLAPNIVYGRIGDGANKWGYLLSPTPGASNVTESSSTLLPAPIFSHLGGKYNESFDLTISIPEGVTSQNLSLCVTTDGREPSLEDAIEGNVFSQNVSATLAVRAKIFASDAHSPLSTTQTYIFHPRETELPIVALNLNKDYLLDEDEGIYVEGKDPDHPNYHQKHRKPFNIELYLDGQQQINQVGELRISGYGSASSPQKSLAIYANKRFGTKRFDTSDIWPDKPEIKEVKSFLLRNGGGIFLRFSEPMLHLLIGRSKLGNVCIQAYRPTITYINGHYAGIYNIRERSNEDWLEANYPDAEKYDMIENWGELKAGSASTLFEFLDLFQNKENCTIENFEKYIDLENFINTFGYEILIRNRDYFCNNIVWWRIGDGKWKLLIKDLDWGVMAEAGTDLFDTLAELKEEYGNISKDSTQYKVLTFFENICQIPDFQELLYKKIAFMLGDFMQMDNFIKLHDELAAEIEDEMRDHIAVYYATKPSYNIHTYHGYSDVFINRFSNQHEVLWEQMQKNLNAPESFELNVESEDIPFAVNENKMSMPAFKGRWFVNTPLTLVSTDSNKEVVSHVTETDADGNESSYVIDGPVDKAFNNNVKSVKVVLKDKKVDGIQDLIDSANEDNTKIEYFDLMGRKISNDAHGIVIKRQGSKVSKVVR